MGKRFNPPPNWPAAPAGWQPGPGWRPDPSWPAPPPGWPLWVYTSRRWPAVVAAGVGGLLFGVGIGGSSGTAAADRAEDLMAEAEQEQAEVRTLLAEAEEEQAAQVEDLDEREDILDARETEVDEREAAVAEVEDVAAAQAQLATDQSTLAAAQQALDARSAELDQREAAINAMAAAAQVPATSVPASSGGGSAYYANCDAARAAGAAPVLRGEPGYRSGLDRDDDGIGCE